MDVYIDGELTIPASKVLEAGKLLLEAIYTRNSGCRRRGDYGAEVAEDDDHRYHEWAKTPEGVVKLIDDKFERFGVELEDDGSLTLGMYDSCRHEEYDQWLFAALAPVIDDGEFYMSGDDYRWKWVVEGGVLSEHSGDTVYDHDDKAVPLVEKLVEIIYPGGKLDPDYGGDMLGALHLIENLLRDNGYGPQAGMNGLERLADS